MDTLDDIHDHNINEKSRIIYLHQVNNEDSISYNTIPTLIKNIDYLNSTGKTPIVIKLIGVDGGDVSQGLACYSVIKNSKSKINIECYGLTASCATVILQAGVDRAISQDGFFMVHFGSISLSADVNAAQSILASNGLWKNQLLNIYSKRCIDGKFFKDRKYSLNRVRGYISTKLKNNGDWYLKDPEEVVAYGFADRVV